VPPHACPANGVESRVWRPVKVVRWGEDLQIGDVALGRAGMLAGASTITWDKALQVVRAELMVCTVFWDGSVQEWAQG
jgi:hypothetical protein